MPSRYLQILLLIGLLALAGCGGAPVSSEPSPTPSSTATPAPTSLPSPTIMPSPTPPGPPQPTAPGVYVSTNDGLLAALNVSNGNQRWEDSNGATYNSLVALDHNVLYVSLSMAVAAYNASDGVRRWTATLDDALGANDGALLIANGIVYVGTDQFLYALNASDGTRRWKSPQPVGPVYSLAISGSTLYLDNGSILAVSASDGTQIWSYSGSMPGPAGHHLSAMALANGVVYTGEAGRTDAPAYIYALDASTGKERWHAQPGITGQTSQQDDVIGLALDTNALYVSEAGVSTATLFALDPTSGSALWHFQPAASVRYATAPVVANGLVYMGTSEASGVVYAVDATSGMPRWRFMSSGAAASTALAYRPLSGGPLVFAPLVLNGIIYIRAGTQVYALDASTGAQQWVSQPGGANFDQNWTAG